VFLAADLSNHHVLLQAVASFANDNNDQLPNPGWGTAEISWACGSNCPAPAYASGNFSLYNLYYPQQLAALTNGQLFPYVRDPMKYRCPGDSPANPLFWQRCVYVTSYTWNTAVDGYGALAGQNPSSYKLSQFRPDALVEWEGDDQSPFWWNDFSVYPDEGISFRHIPETIVGQFGGNAASIVTSNWYGIYLAGPEGGRGATIPGSLLPNRVWCNPGKLYGLP
jgi:hypothetical protein